MTSFHQPPSFSSGNGLSNWAAMMIDDGNEACALVDDERQVLYRNSAFDALLGKPASVGSDASCIAAESVFEDAALEDVWSRLKQHGQWQGYLHSKSPEKVIECSAMQMQKADSDQHSQTYIFTLRDYQMPFMTSSPDSQLPNQDCLLQYLDSMLQGPRPRDNFSLVAVNLQRFDSIRVNFGHDIGKQVSQALEQRLLAQRVPMQFVAKLSSSKFVIVTEYLGAGDECEQLSALLNAGLCEPMQVEGCRLHFNFAYGVAHAPKHGANAQHLLQNTELALAHAEQKENCKCVTYSLKLGQQSQRHYALFQSIKEALALKAFDVHYQPQVNGRDQSVIGLEALIRWPTEAGYIPPNLFLPVAAQFDLLADIDLYVFERVLQQIQHANLRGIKLPKVAINISEQLIPIPEIRALLHQYNICPDQVEIEITEQMLASDTKALNEYLKEVRKLGISIALDDFGTGYSSLGRLMDLPVDRIKIERRFVEHIEDEPQHLAYLKAMIDLCRVSNKQVLVEGTETETQRQLLCELGCELQQGFLFARPMPLSTFTQTQDTE